MRIYIMAGKEEMGYSISSFLKVGKSFLVKNTSSSSRLARLNISKVRPLVRVWAVHLVEP
jgi:hypothetical protein